MGPATLNLRSDFPIQSSTVVTVKHGDRLEIVEQHRLFVKVRAPNGAEGWIEQRQLLGADDMAALRALAKRAASMPSQGTATTDADLRVHIQPAAGSPSFLTLKENDKVDVLTHLRRPRTDLPRKPLVPPPPKKVKATKKSAKNAQIPPPPMPAPPPPPANWLELSKSDEADDEPEPPAASAPPVATDDWSLVRAPTANPAGFSRAACEWRFPTKWRSTPRATASCRISRWASAGWRSAKGHVALDDRWRWRAALRFRQLARIRVEPAPSSLRNGIYREESDRLFACGVAGGPIFHG